MPTIIVLIFCSIILTIDFYPLYKEGKRKETILYGILFFCSTVILLLSSLEAPLPHLWNYFVH